MKTGRPSKYKPEYCKMLKQHLIEGLSYESFAGLLGVSRESLYEWERKFKEFADTKKQYIEAARLFWEKMGRAGASGQITGFNCTAWLFTMKNRFGYRDRQDLNIAGEGGGPIKYQNLSQAQINSQLEQILRILSED